MTTDEDPATVEPRCDRKVGEKPWWMGSDQYDPCYCLLLPNHGGDCKCSHAIGGDQ